MKGESDLTLLVMYVGHRAIISRRLGPNLTSGSTQLSFHSTRIRFYPRIRTQNSNTAKADSSKADHASVCIVSK